MIKAAFNKNHCLYIPFIMAGYPSRALSKKAIRTLCQQGADVIELGVPFSDPIADGPVNQLAALSAIANGINLDDVLLLVKELREEGCDTPIMLFSYLNPLLNAGIENFCQKAKAVGINGLLIVDLPPEEGGDIFNLIQLSGLEISLLVSPTTNPNRLLLYKAINPSFIYYISRLSVTGAKARLSKHLHSQVSNLRSQLPELSIAVGFGISNPSQAAAVAKMADGVVMGSILVATLANDGFEAFSHLSKALAKTIHQYPRQTNLHSKCQLFDESG